MLHLRGAKSIYAAAGAGKDAILELLLPPACRLCNGPVHQADDFCRSCELALTLSQSRMQSGCLRCGFPRPVVTTPSVGDGDDSRSDEFADSATSSAAGDLSSCVHCQKLKFHFQGVVALWAYQDRVCDAVVAAKYAHQTPLADAMGRRLGVRIQSVFAADLPEFVTSVPSHVTRQFSRGGNGNLAIAAAAAGVIGRPCHSFLRTTRRIAKQAWLDDAGRVENVRDAFSLKKSYAFSRSPEIAGRHVLVVDDVLTTGATANEVARVLRDGGARRVSLAVVARALRSP